MKGNVKVELMEEGTKQVVESSNFVGRLAKKLMFRVGVSAITRYAFSNGIMCTGLNTVYCFDRLSLTDNIESVSTDAVILPGTEIGWADHDIYVGSDTKRGTLNKNESSWNENELKLVFDFATDKANGTFRTIGFKATTPQYNYDIPKAAGAYALDAFTYDGQHFYGYKSGHILKIDAVTLEILEDIITPTLGGVDGIVHLNGRFIVNVPTQHYWKLYELNRDTNTWEQKLNAYEYYLYTYGLATDGTYLYACRNQQTPYIYRIPIDFSSSFESKNISYSRSYFNVQCLDGKIHRYDSGTIYGLDLDDFFNGTITETALVSGLDMGGFPIQPLYLNGNVYGLLNDLTYYSMFESYSDGGFAIGEGFSSNLDKVFCQFGNGKADLGTCVVLPSAVTKNDTQTMKITYTFTFNG